MGGNMDSRHQGGRKVTSLVLKEAQDLAVARQNVRMRE